MSVQACASAPASRPSDQTTGPAAIWLAAKRRWLPLIPAAAIWAAAGHFNLVVGNSLTGEPFAPTLLPWSLIFTCGIALGAAQSGNAAPAAVGR